MLLRSISVSTSLPSKFRTATAALLLTGAFGLVATPALAAVPAGPHITITGSGEVQAKPDAAVLSLQLRAEEPTSLAAKRSVDTRVNDLLAGLERFGVDTADVSASSLSTSQHVQHTRDGENKVVGYRARRTLTITLKDITKLNDFMDFALSVEVNEINNIQLTATNAAAFEAQALAQAVENAKQQGRHLAESFDAELGTVYSINAGQTHSRFAYGQHEMVAARADAAAPGQYLEETITFNATINVVFNLTTD